MNAANRNTSVAVLRLVISGVLLLAWAALIFSFSASQGEESQGLSTRLIVWALESFVPGYDAWDPSQQLALQELLSTPVRKLAHYTEYAILGLLAFVFFVQLAKLRAIRAQREGEVPDAAVAAVSRAHGETASASGEITPSGVDQHTALPSWVPIAALCLSVLYACTDEFHQLFVDGRSAQVTDVLIDSVGALSGVLLTLLIYRRLQRRR